VKLIASKNGGYSESLVNSKRSTFMSQDIEVIVYPVSNLAQAKTLFHTLLGVGSYVDQPYYVGFRVGDLEIGLEPYGHKKGITGPIVYASVTGI
jgi:hypothetical protein